MDGSGGFIGGLEAFFTGTVVAALEAVIFFDVWFWDGGPGQPDVKLPLVVLWLMIGATFFTLRFRFINLRGFRHAIDCVRGRYTRPDEAGEISHFQALSAALSATVGLGNIAGVAFAVGIGGPGAVFWMTVAGFLGMTSKFAECTLGLKYRGAARGRPRLGRRHALPARRSGRAWGCPGSAPCSRWSSP